MSGGSLRLRLLAGTLAWMLVTITLVGWGLRALFRDHIEQQFHAQLVRQLDQLSAGVDWLENTRLQVKKDSMDARLEQPLSGLYWQIERQEGAAHTALARSRSLWDQVLTLPATAAYSTRPDPWALHIEDAQGHRLLAVVRTLQLPDDGAPLLRLVVAGDEALWAEPLERFTRLLLFALALLALGLALAVALQLQLALRPLALLHQRLSAVRSGAAVQLEGQFAQELQPLVDEFNHVLRENADMVQRARTQAGNLAHAVHTPLAILANAAAQEDSALAQMVSEQVQSARRQVDWHLARARAAAAVRATGLAVPVLPVAQALLRTMTRLHAAREIDFALVEAGVPAHSLAFRGEEQDLYELLGNLLDNAGKSARTQVLLELRCEGSTLVCTIDDDGPGIPLAQRHVMFARGVQLDEERPGSGLGLDIVRSLSETYGGSVQVLDAPLGGARLELRLPAAPLQPSPP